MGRNRKKGADSAGAVTETPTTPTSFPYYNESSNGSYADSRFNASNTPLTQVDYLARGIIDATRGLESGNLGFEDADVQAELPNVLRRAYDTVVEMRNVVTSAYRNYNNQDLDEERRERAWNRNMRYASDLAERISRDLSFVLPEVRREDYRTNPFYRLEDAVDKLNTYFIDGVESGFTSLDDDFESRARPLRQNVENIVGGSDEPAYSSTNIPSGWTPADGDVGISRTFGDRTFNIIPNGFERRGGKPYYSVEITDARGNRIGNPTVISRNPEASWQELTNIINTVTGGVVRNYESYANRTLSSRKEIIDDLKRQHAKIRQEYNRVAQGRLNRPAINRVLAKEREVVQQLRDIRENIASELKTASARARREATGRLSPSVQRLLNHQEGLRAQLRAIPRWATKLPASENALGNSANPGPYAVPLPSNRNIPL